MTTLKFFFVDTEMVSITICFNLLLLMKHPDIAGKVEGDRGSGGHRPLHHAGNRLSQPHFSKISGI